jgi:hypothetical protein
MARKPHFRGGLIAVQKKACATCIFRKDSPLDLATLLDAIRDKRAPGFFKGYRICHHSHDACCRGFWNRHKDHFQQGQVAQRLDAVVFVNDDTLRKSKKVNDDERSRHRPAGVSEEDAPALYSV